MIYLLSFVAIAMCILISLYVMNNDRVLRKAQNTHNARYKVMLDIKKAFTSFFS